MNLKRLTVEATFSSVIGLLCFSPAARLQIKNTLRPTAAPEKIIIDTDIGDDIDDAFAVGLALASKELKIVGITSAWGDTRLRAQLLDRPLCETGRSDIPVATGIATRSTTDFSQAAWARQGPPKATPGCCRIPSGSDTERSRPNHADRHCTVDQCRSGGRQGS